MKIVASLDVQGFIVKGFHVAIIVVKKFKCLVLKSTLMVSLCLEVSLKDQISYKRHKAKIKLP